MKDNEIKPKVEQFACGHCEGSGYLKTWNQPDETFPADLVIIDCHVCETTGKVKVNVIDLRDKSKKKPLKYEKKY